jgi:hypothetical protein
MMKLMSMRERLMAVIQGKEIDRVPLIMYEDLMPERYQEEFPRRAVRAAFGDRIGLLRWSAVHRVVAPHCRFVTEEIYAGATRCERTTLYTPAGSIWQERAFEPVFNSGATRKHYIEEARDYEVLWSYLEDGVVLEDYARYNRDQAELGDLGLPLAAVERSPFQQLWVEWVGLEHLSFHLADYPDRVARTIALLTNRARQIFEIARRSPAPMIDFPDNITAPAVGLKRFQMHCVPLYNELADLLAERGAPVFVHMDGDLKPLWQAIAASRVGGIDSFSPCPDNDTSVAEAAALWPQMRLFVNFPSSVHLRSYDEVRAEAELILNAAGHTGRLEIQFSENVPYAAWPTSFRAVADAVDAFRP